MRRGRRSTAATFVVHAALTGTLAPRLPAIKSGAGLDDGQLGLALVALAGGLLLGTLCAGPCGQRFGSRASARAAALVLCAALPLVALPSSLAPLAVGLGVLGLAAGLLDVSMNVQAAEVERRSGHRVMSGLHGLWSLTGMAAAGVAAAAAAAGAGPLAHFTVVAVALAVLAAVTGPGLQPDAAREATAQEAPPPAWSPAVSVLGAIGFCAFVSEGSAGDWSAVYLRDTLASSEALAAAGFGLFSGSMGLARLGADRLAERVGPVLVVRAGALIAGVGLATALLVHRPAAALAGFAVLGFGLGPVVPLAFSAAGALGAGRDGGGIARVAAVAYVGSVAGPAVIGGLAQELGLRSALLLPAALAGAVAIMAPRVGGAQTSTTTGSTIGRRLRRS